MRSRCIVTNRPITRARWQITTSRWRDCSTRSVDSAGLGELVSAYTTATNQNGSLKLLHLQGKLHDLMQITKLHTIFTTFDDEKKAVESFGAGAAA